MDLYYEDIEELRDNLECEIAGCSQEAWKRWDDELVEDFSRWLNRVAKVFLIAVGVVSAAVLVRLL
jgi:hypothetical protein